MNKIFITGLALLAFGAMQARTLSPEEALERVHASGAPAKAKALGTQARPRLVHTAVTEQGQPAVYVFNNDGQGYMMLSADDVAYPVLAYSDNGAVEPSAMPEQMRWWLDEYARQIEYAKANPSVAKATAKAASQGPAIAPMIKTSWDQGAPYNSRCPLIDGVRSYTGCVATAMAQVMNYWQYPAQGQGSISYNDDGSGKRLSYNFANFKPDWANMADTYNDGNYTEAQADAVARLMQAAGYAVKMNYGTDSSGALAMEVHNGLVKYFGYDANIFYTLRSIYSSSMWHKMIYENLRDVGPIMYGGASYVGGGHSFVLDGYDGEGYYHFNWGWSEMSDGYYSLEALNPQALGAGGGGGGGYNFTQDAVLGIQPPTGQPVVERPYMIMQMGTLLGGLDADNLVSLNLDGQNGAMWVNYEPKTLKLQFGVSVEPAQPGSGEVQYQTVGQSMYQLQTGYGIAPDGLKAQVDLPALNLADGTYKITLCTRLTETEGAAWVPVQHNYGDYNYILVKREGDTYTVENMPVNDLTITAAKFEGSVYYGPLNTFSVTVENNTGVELSRGMAPMIFDESGQPMFIGESVFVSLAPGESVTRTFTTSLIAMSQQAAYLDAATNMLLTVFDESTYNIHTEEILESVVVRPQPALPSLVFTKRMAIEGAVSAGTTEIGGYEYPLYEIADASNIKVTARFRNNGGVMAYNTYACIIGEPDEQNRTEILAYNGQPVSLSPLRTTDFETTLNFKQAKPGVAYTMTMAIETSQGLVPVGNQYLAFRVPGQSGVDDLEIDAEDESLPVEYYNLQGIRLSEPPVKGLYIERRGNSVVKKLAY